MFWLARTVAVLLLLLSHGSFPHARAALGESVGDASRQALGAVDAPSASTRQGEAQLAERSEQAGGWGLPNPKKLKTYEVNYLWDGDELAAEIHSKEGTRVHVHRPGTFVPLLQVEGGEVFHVISDHLGTPKELIDESGRVAWSAAHGAWNQIQEQWYDDAHPRGRRVASPFRGLGQYYDAETQLSCTRYRYWEAGTGRWLSGDPLGVGGGWNLFGFDGIPALEVDPLGLACEQARDSKGGFMSKDGSEAAPGAAAEAAALKARGLDKNSERIAAPSGQTEFRVPDGMDSSGRRIVEIKKVDQLSLTKQLQDDVAHVTRPGANGKPGSGRVEVVVDNRTQVSGPLQAAHDDPSNPITITREALR